MGKHIRVSFFLLVLTALSFSNLFAASKATISWKYVNLRETPSEDAEIITELVKGVPVTLLQETDEWYRIESEQEIVGWVVKRSLKVTQPVTFKAETSGPPPVAVKPASEGKELLTFSQKQNNQKKEYDENEPEVSTKKTDIKPAADTNSPQTEATDTGGGYLDEAPATEMPEFPSFTGTFLKMLSSLFIIIGMILLLYYVVKKYFSKSILSLEGASAISVLASKYIGQKTIIYVIDVMEKVIVVGIIGSEMKLLTEISDKASMDRMRKDISSIKEAERPFKKFFSDKVKSTGPVSYTGPKEESFDILDEVNERIEKKVDGLRDMNDR